MVTTLGSLHLPFIQKLHLVHIDLPAAFLALSLMLVIIVLNKWAAVILAGKKQDINACIFQLLQIILNVLEQFFDFFVCHNLIFFNDYQFHSVTNIKTYYLTPINSKTGMIPLKIYMGVDGILHHLLFFFRKIY